MSTYHEPEPVRGKFRSNTGQTHDTWQAQCACGWRGPSRGRWTDADEDCMEHRMVENKDQP